MDPGSRSSLMFVFPQRSKSGDAATRTSIDESPSTPTEATLPGTSEKHKSLSLSWLSPHRRKDSGISISTRSSKSLRISSPAAAATARSDRSSFGSRLSRESNRLSADSSKLISTFTNEPAVVAISPRSIQSPSFPPKRPERPLRGLFDDLLDDAREEADEQGEAIEASRANESGKRPAKIGAGCAVYDAEDANASSAETPVTRRSRELLGLAFEAVGVSLPDKRNRLSCASIGSDSSAALPTAADNELRRQHHKAFSESLVATHLNRSSSTASSPSRRQKSLASSPARIATGKHPRPSRWTLTESMADMFKSQKSPKLRADHDDGKSWMSLDSKKEPKKNTVVQRLASEYPILAELLGNQAHPEEELVRVEPYRRPDGLRSSFLGPNGPRQRAIPFEISIPPPPTSVLHRHGYGPMEPQMPPHMPPQQQGQWPMPCTTKKWVNHEVMIESDALAGDRMHYNHGLDVTGAREHAPVQNDGTDSISFGLLIPPPKNPARFSTRAPTMPQLPPIPEGPRMKSGRRQFLQPQPWLQPPSSSHHRSRSLSHLGVETEECVYFQSTPFTLTNPAFRHGPITFHKREIRRGSLPMDQTFLDAAAFQSAIGGVGDLGGVFAPEQTWGGPDRDDDQEDEDESHMADEMTAWFEEFGFETHGELISAEKPVERNLDRTSWDSACSMGTTSSMPLIIKTDLADSAAEGQQEPWTDAANAPNRESQQQQQHQHQQYQLATEDVNAGSLHAPSFHDLTLDYTTY